jgi:hypothetical protein
VRLRTVTARARGWLFVPLVATASAAAACPSCETHGASSGAAELDPGPTFGAEITVGVVGRGRVSGAGGLDCPSTCFARVVLDDPSVDGAAQGLSLTAEATVGAHFAGWKLEAMDLGVRARGPSRCSPMLRATTTTAPIGTRSSQILLPLGETTGVPPRGHEAECAEFTTVPLAYALTATFDENIAPVDAGLDAPDSRSTILFEPPSGSSSVAREIGIAGESVYWRFQQTNGLSGLARGSLGGGVASVIVPADRLISVFDVDRHVVYQRAGVVYAIEGGKSVPAVLGGAPICAALASDSGNAYCRASNGAVSLLYGWPVAGAAAPVLLHTLPRGFALAVDETQQRFYVSDEPGGISAGTIVSVPRVGDGGAPVITTLVVGQTSPKNLVASATRLFWIDDRFSGSFVATSASKFAPGTALQGFISSTVPFVATDPGSTALYWLGIGSAEPGGSRILRLAVGGGATVFRSNLTGLGGLTVDATYVYWTEADGRVYRAPKLDF